VTDTPSYDDANLALRLYELRREPEMRKARDMVGDLLDGASWTTVQEVRRYDHPENAHFRQVTSYWEIVASFVNRGILHPDVYLDTCGEGLYVFSVLRPHVERIRASGSPRFLAQTERLVSERPAARERVAEIERRMEAARAEAREERRSSALARGRRLRGAKVGK
jgi:hypothetical protein